MKTILDRKVAGEPMTQNVLQKICKEYLFQEKNFSLFLEGGLGAGKTFCARQILQFFGVGDEIASPTYTYVQEYSGKSQEFSHFDCYRIRGDQEFFEKGFQEIAENPNTHKIVEWPERLSEECISGFSGKHFFLRIDHGIGASMRRIRFLEKNS